MTWLFVPQFEEDREPVTLRMLATQYVEGCASAMRDEAVGSSTAAEMASWSLKASIAANYDATGVIHPMLMVEASTSGETVEKTVDRIRVNAARYAALEGSVAGWRRAALNAIAQPGWHIDPQLPDVPTLAG